MPRKKHSYHYIYRVTCNVTGKYYIGMHSTSNLEDGYFGSGKILKRSLNKYGKDNHSIEVLEWLSDRSSLKLREKEIVNESLLTDSMCMNLTIGGEGGAIFKGRTHSDETKLQISLKLKGSKASDQTKMKISKANSERKVSDLTKAKISETCKRTYSNRGNVSELTKKGMTPEVKIKISEAAKRREELKRIAKNNIAN